MPSGGILGKLIQYFFKHTSQDDSLSVGAMHIIGVSAHGLQLSCIFCSMYHVIRCYHMATSFISAFSSLSVIIGDYISLKLPLVSINRLLLSIA